MKAEAGGSTLGGASRKTAGLFVLLPILSGAGWGVAGVFVRIFSAAGLDNPTIVFTRTAVCALLTFLVILAREHGLGRGRERGRGKETADRADRRAPGSGKPGSGKSGSGKPRSMLRMKLRDIPIVLAISVFGSVVLMVAYNIAVTSLSLSLAAILLCTAPIFVLLISTVLFHERITRKKVLCMILAILGCGMLSGLFSGGGLQWSLFGLLMGAAAALCNAVFIIMSKLIATRGYSSFTVSFYSSLFASLILMFFVDWSALLGYLHENPLQGPLLILIQSICTSLMPSLIYIVAMRHVEAGRVAILQSGAEPTAAFLAGLILYAEVPTATGLAGMVITIIALMILAGSRE